MSKWGDTLAIGNADIRAGFDQGARGLDVARSAIAQHNRLDQGRPAQIVDMIEWRAGFNQGYDNVEMP